MASHILDIYGSRRGSTGMHHASIRVLDYHRLSDELCSYCYDFRLRYNLVDWLEIERDRVQGV